MAAAARGGDKGSQSVTAHKATLGCVVQLTAMVNMLQSNLAYFSTATEAPSEAVADVTSVVEQALQDVQPIAASSQGSFVPVLEPAVSGVVEQERCALVRMAHCLCHGSASIFPSKPGRAHWALTPAASVPPGSNLVCATEDVATVQAAPRRRHHAVHRQQACHALPGGRVAGDRGRVRGAHRH